MTIFPGNEIFSAKINKTSSVRKTKTNQPLTDKCTQINQKIKLTSLRMRETGLARLYQKHDVTLHCTSYGLQQCH